jgi:hypothetical protein
VSADSIKLLEVQGSKQDELRPPIVAADGARDLQDRRSREAADRRLDAEAGAGSERIVEIPAVREVQVPAAAERIAERGRHSA